jgi:hypothetical protein
MMGFTKIVYVATTPKEVAWMTLPSKAVEVSHSIDYSDYQSPDPDMPEKGFLAVHAVTMIAQYIRNFVMEVANEVMIPPPFEIEVPPLQTYTFVPVTGQVIARTILGPTEAKVTAKATAKKSSADLAGSDGETPAVPATGSAAGKVPPPQPKLEGKNVKQISTDGAASDGAEDSEEEEPEDGDEEQDEEDDVAALEKLEAKVIKAKSKGKKKASKAMKSTKRGAPRSGDGVAKKKPRAKK